MDAGPSTSQERPAHIPPPVAVPDAVLRAIYGERGAAEKKAEFENSLRRWWATYAERKDDEDEYVADTLLYDKSHLPRTAPAPECVRRPGQEALAEAPATEKEPEAREQAG